MTTMATRPAGAAATGRDSAPDAAALRPAAVPRDPVLRGVVACSVVVLLALTAVSGHSMVAAAIAVLATGAAAVACLLAPEPEDRAFAALAALITLNVGLPLTRIPDARLLLQVMIAACLALTVGGGYGLTRPFGARACSAVLALLALMTVVTALSPDVGSFKRWLVSGLVALPAFVLASRPGARMARRVGSTVVALGVVEALVAVVEPLAFPTHLWAPAQRDSDGVAVPLLNDLLGGSLERSQGTLGHPLTLGLLLVTAVALAVRACALRKRVLVPVLAVLMAGLVTSGARTSLLMAALIVIFASARRPTFLHVLAGIWTMALLAVIGVYAGVVSGAALDEIMSTGSYTHRLGALASFGNLIGEQSTGRVLIGNGFGAAPRLFSAGLLQNDGFTAIDNEFLGLLGQAGLVGLLLFVAVVVLALVTGPAEMRLAMLCITATLMVFDVVGWPVAVALTFAVLGIALRPAETVDDPLVRRPAAGAAGPASLTPASLTEDPNPPRPRHR